MKRRITFNLGLGAIFALVASSFIAGMIVSDKALAISPPHSTPVPLNTCLSGFTRSAGPAGYENVIYTCTSQTVACSRGHRVVRRIGFFGDPTAYRYSPHFDNPNTNGHSVANGVFVYSCGDVKFPNASWE